jgi:hypothetical protein
MSVEHRKGTGRRARESSASQLRSDLAAVRAHGVTFDVERGAARFAAAIAAPAGAAAAMTTASTASAAAPAHSALVASGAWVKMIGVLLLCGAAGGAGVVAYLPGPVAPNATSTARAGTLTSSSSSSSSSFETPVAAPSIAAPPPRTQVAPPPSATSRPRYEAAKPASTNDALEREVEELRELRRLLRTDPAELVRRCEAGTARGVLGQEREFLRIAALVALGRRDAAGERAAAFRRAHPGSALAARLDELVGPP